MSSLVQRRAPQWEAKAVVEGRIEDRNSKQCEGTVGAPTILKIRAFAVWFNKLNHIVICFYCREVLRPDVLSL